MKASTGRERTTERVSWQTGLEGASQGVRELSKLLFNVESVSIDLALRVAGERDPHRSVPKKFSV